MRQKQGVFSLFLLSPSSRRAWIEILSVLFSAIMSSVALLAEGVDRNSCRPGSDPAKRSPSSRRAWIEIVKLYHMALSAFVALLAEGVDRNLLAMMVMVPSLCRPPRGGRG